MSRVIVGHGLVGNALARLMPDAIRIHHDDRLPEFHGLDVYWAAAKVGGVADNSEHQADFFVENMATTMRALRVCAAAEARKLMLFGSVCMYPRAAPLPHTEDMLGTGPFEPSNAGYAAAKLAGVHAAQAYRDQYGLDVVTVIPCNLYGPGDHSTHAIPEIVSKLHQAKLDYCPPKLFRPNAVREFMHVDDLARACEALMASSEHAVYNVGSGRSYIMTDIVSILARHCRYAGRIEWGHGPAGAPARIMSSDRLRREHVWRPRIDLEDGLREVCE